MSWATFIKAHLRVLVGMDFFTVAPVTWLGLIRHHLLLVLIASDSRAESGVGGVARRERLGGLLRFYYREAA
jgi:hypothetical protein